MKHKLYNLHKKVQKTCNAFFLRRKIKARSGRLIKDANELSTLMNERAFLHNEEVPLLSKYAHNVCGVIVEIGSAFGGSPALLLVNKKEETEVHSIDPFIVDSMANFQATEEKCRKNVEKVLSATKKSNAIKKWILHKDYSYNVIKHWRKPINLMFIDGDHTYEAVKRDFIDWFPHVKKGGLILFHDSRKEMDTPLETFNRGWVGPTKFVSELKSDKRLQTIDEAFSITVLKKIHE